MSQQRYHWQEPNQIPDDIQIELSSFSPVFQSILYQRGISTNSDALDFLLPKPPGWYPNINLLQVEKACQLISEMINSKKKIAVYGDYDADGITSTALLTLALREIGASVIPYIPDRESEGYGLNKLAITSLADQDVSLLITVDNGIRSHEEVEHANGLGMRVIITDHHTPGDSTPPAAVILNPKLPDDPYPNKNLAGVGVAYKLIIALSNYFKTLNPENYLDLVAIGTVADIVPLVGENRYLVRQGLGRLNFNKRQAVHSLFAASGIENKRITASDISFQIAPRINSSGRLESESALIPLNLLLSSNPADCSKYAQILENHNHKRKILSKDLSKKVENIILSQKSSPPLLIVFDPEILLGVAGIAAGYLSRKFNLPAIVGQTTEELTTASCRSIPAFNIIDALDKCQDLFVHYGGHSMAAGFTIKNQNIPYLISRLNELALSQMPQGPQTPILEIDAEVTLEDLDAQLYKEIEKLEPTGSRNPVPVFIARNLIAVKPKTVGSNSDHLKLVVSDGTYSLDAIGFGFGHLLDDLPGSFDLAFNLTVNEYRGVKRLQLQILDLVPA